MAGGISGMEVKLGEDFDRKWKAAVRNVEEWVDDLLPKMKPVIEEYADKVFEEAVREVPVDTGNLRSTIEQIFEEMAESVLKAMVGTQKTTYAAYQEFGTTIHEAQPYLRPALKKYAKEFVKAVADTVQEHANDAHRYK
jgi:HK97 gp10 family phage protein